MTEENKKAVELVDKFCVEINPDSLISDFTKYETRPRAKQCALICVDELIKAFENFSIEQHGKIGIDYGHGFWQDVKKEIEKL